MFQFILESISLSVIGSVIGMILGWIVTYLVAVVIQYLGYTWPFLVTFQSVGVAFVIAIGIGVVFGAYPARRASRVSPTEALRYE